MAEVPSCVPMAWITCALSGLPLYSTRPRSETTRSWPLSARKTLMSSHQPIPASSQSATVGGNRSSGSPWQASSESAGTPGVSVGLPAEQQPGGCRPEPIVRVSSGSARDPASFTWRPCALMCSRPAAAHRPRAEPTRPAAGWRGGVAVLDQPDRHGARGTPGRSRPRSSRRWSVTGDEAELVSNGCRPGAC